MTPRDSVSGTRAGDPPPNRPVGSCGPPSGTPTEYETIFRTVDDAVFLVDVDSGGEECAFRYKRVNPAYESATQLGTADLRGQSPRDAFGDDTGAEFAENYRRCVERGATIEYEETLDLPVGRREFETKLTPVSTDGEVTQIVGIARDVTERAERTRALERSRDLLSKTERLAGVGGWELDCRTGDLRWTDGTRSVFDVDAEFEPTLSDAVEFYRPDDRERIRGLVERCRDRGEAYDAVLRAVTGDGDERWVRSFGEPVYADTDDGPPNDREVVALRGAVLDVTEEKNRERDLKMFERAVEQAGHGVLITDREGQIEYVNPAYESDTGYSREEAVGRSPRIVKSDKHGEEFYADLWETVLSGDTWEANIVNRRRSGELYYVDQTIAPIRDGDEITHFVGIESETTERVLREQRLDVLTRVLRHNLRNAVTVVQGNASILREELDEELRPHAAAIEEWADDLAEISEKAATVQSLFERSPVDDPVCAVEGLLSDVVAGFEETHPDAEITVEAPDGVRVKADDRLAVALREAVDNALTHHDRTPPEVRISVTPARTPDTWVDIAVVDTGPGIPEAERAVIERGEETPVVHGTGIGLWLVHWVVATFGGELAIRDNDPRGTVLVLRVPAATTPDES